MSKNKSYLDTMLLRLLLGLPLLLQMLAPCCRGDDVKADTFQVTTDLPTAAILSTGTEITVTAKLAYPETYSFCGSSIYAYQFNLPGNFCAVTGKTTSTPKDPKWSSVKLEPMIWVPAADRRGREHQRAFSTQS